MAGEQFPMGKWSTEVRDVGSGLYPKSQGTPSQGFKFGSDSLQMWIDFHPETERDYQGPHGI